MPVQFPLLIEDKVDHPDRLVALQNTLSKYYSTAAEINLRRDAINDLYNFYKNLDLNQNSAAIWGNLTGNLTDQLDLKAKTDAMDSAIALNTADRHNHSNKATIDKFGEDINGLPTYNGLGIDTTIAQRDVYDGLDSLDNTISLSANNGKILKDIQDTQQIAINLNTDKSTDVNHVALSTTTDLTEGINLYYTNARVKSYSDTLYSQLGHQHIIDDITGLQTILDTSNNLTSIDSSNISAVEFTMLDGTKFINSFGHEHTEYQLNLDDGIGFVKSNNGIISYDNNTYLTTQNAESTYVPYSGANANVDLGVHTIKVASVNIDNLTSGKLPYDNGTSLIDSPIFTNGTNVAIGTTLRSGYKLDINGNLWVTGNIIATGEIQAYAVDGTIGSIFDSLPIASTWDGVTPATNVSSGIASFKDSQFTVDASGWVSIKDSILVPASHTHAISDIINLQTSLDAKVDDSQVLTNVPSGAVFTDTIYDDTGLQADRHTHSNKTVLDKFGENGSGLPTYNGNNVDTTIAQRDVYDGLDSVDNTISLSAKQGKVLKDVQDTQQTAIDLNTAKETNIAHPLVETAVPVGAVFTDTVYTLPFTDNSTDWNTAFGWGYHNRLKDVDSSNISAIRFIMDDDSELVRSFGHEHTEYELKIDRDLFYLDTVNQRIGIGRTPTGTSKLQVKGSIWVASGGDSYLFFAPPTDFTTSILEVSANSVWLGDFDGAGNETSISIQDNLSTISLVAPIKVDITTPEVSASAKSSAQSFEIKNSSGVMKWSISLGTSDVLEFKNASGVVEATLDQSGNLLAKGEITAYSI